MVFRQYERTFWHKLWQEINYVKRVSQNYPEIKGIAAILKETKTILTHRLLFKNYDILPCVYVGN